MSMNRRERRRERRKKASDGIIESSEILLELSNDVSFTSIVLYPTSKVLKALGKLVGIGLKDG